jgi:hypothetical protein
MAVVVDTNVAMVASRLHQHADEQCVNSCIERLYKIQQSGGLLVDDRGLIIHEYTKCLGYSGQPGAGHAFVKWAHSNQAITNRVQKITITPRPDDGWRRFEEFPDLPDLKNFDKSDQKFVAVALASGVRTPILNAMDSDWKIHYTSLQLAGVVIEFICPQHFSSQSKRGRRSGHSPRSRTTRRRR